MADLYDTTELIAQLTSKLAELDAKVAAYRLDMANQFNTHSEELLRVVPGDVAYRVSQALSESLSHYPSLYPPGSLSSSPSPITTTLHDKMHFGRGSPPPLLPHTSGSPKDAAATKPFQTRGPHERELEFQGLFIPTYLPLLEKVDRPQHLSPSSHVPAPASPGPAPAPSGAAVPEPATTDRQPSPRSALSSENSPRRGRPSPLRRATNTSIDSGASDSSSGRTRKSALRRPSSASSRAPDSPRDFRRVRFDFQGEEVLPSSSPSTSSTALPDIDVASPPLVSAQEPYMITSLGDLECEEDENQLGLPKKVSSTQALRALSKTPLDEGTVWTIVNTESASETSSLSDADKVRRNTASNSSSPFATQEASMDTDKGCDRSKEEARSQTRGRKDDPVGSSQPMTITRQQEEHEEDSDDEEDSDEEANALFMMSRKGGQKTPLPTASKAASRKSLAATAQQAPVPAGDPNQVTAPAASPRPVASSSMVSQPGVFGQTTATNDVAVSPKGDVQAKVPRKHEPQKSPTPVDDDDDDDEAFFEFDEDDQSVRFKHTELGSESPKKYLSETSSDDDKESDVTPADFPREDKEAPGNKAPCSPRIAIADRRRPATPEQKVPKKVPRKPAGNRPPSTSIGTYDGKPVTPHVVKNKALRDQLKNQESDVPFFVGSVNGNSGVDASNVKSYQASVMSPTTASGGFASGSFAERLMWERSQGVTYDSDGEGRQADKGGDKDDTGET